VNSVDTNRCRVLAKVDQLRRDADALRREAAHAERIASLCSQLADAYDTIALIELPLVGRPADPDPPVEPVSAVTTEQTTAG
jgi:hypothetical protein